MPSPSKDHVDAASVTVYMDTAEEWRWRARDTNGEIVADSGEGYASHEWAVKAAQDLFPDAELKLTWSDK